MDSEDASNIHDELSRLEKNNNRTSHFLKKQTTVIKSNFDTLSTAMKNSTEDIQKMSIQLNYFSRQIEEKSLRINENTEISNFEIRVEMVINLLNVKLRAIEQHQQSEVTILHELINKKLHPLLLNKNEIAEIFDNIQKYHALSSELRNFNHLNQLSNIDVLPGKEQVLIKLRIPLPNVEKFEIKKIYNVPVKVSNKYSLLIDTGNVEAVAENLQKTAFVEMTEETLSKCINLWIKQNKFIKICKNEGIIMTTLSDHCLVQLLLHYPSSKQNCKVVLVEMKQNWLVKMVAQNSWLYNADTNQKLTITCGSQSNYIDLLGLGVLQVLKPCELSNNMVRIHYSQDFKATIKINTPNDASIKKINFEAIKLAIDRMNFTDLSNKNSSTKTMLKIHNQRDFNNEIKKRQKSINDLQSLWEQNEKQRLADLKIHFEIQRYKYGGISFVTIILIIIIVAVVIIIWCKCKKNSKNSQQSVNIQLSDLEKKAPTLNSTKNDPHPLKKYPFPK